ncbi:hypothetical protein OJF2_31480 [Aquisphaera giovannonii]|uniref:Lipoprotein n=1 Tax=Aquisphaera giovannonii TaxID=406548 RepID=A0A5B9W2Y6_9BACT|nr:DUF6655 family protein [Aquisphaera giovannonii]QEH34607.1 hypothetical protein OJF2_31480 [Aquisphaera giovannonii]
MSRRRRGLRLVLALAVGGGGGMSGCVSVTTKITGSARAGAEQLLLTGTSQRAVDSIDFRPLAGRKAFLAVAQEEKTDASWLVFSLRREMARQGVILVDDKKEAEVLVEGAVAAYGTDEVDSRISLPSITALGTLPLPASSGSSTGGLIQKNRQDAVVKLALVALDAKSRQLVWETDDVLQTGYLYRRFMGSTNITRSTSVPELECYPPRKAH